MTEDEQRLGPAELSEMRGRVVAKARRPKAGRALAVIGAAAAVVVVVAVPAWIARVQQEPAPVASTPTSAPSASGELAEAAVGLWISGAAPYLLIFGDGTLVGHNGCSGLDGTWTWDPTSGAVDVGAVTVSAAGCLEPTPVGAFSLDEPSPLHGDTLLAGGGTPLHRSESVQWKAGTTLMTFDEPQTAGDGALLAGELAFYETGLATSRYRFLGIAAGDGAHGTPVVFPAGTVLHDDGRSIDVPGSGTFSLGDEISAGGGIAGEASLGVRLIPGDEIFLAHTITR